MSAKFTDPQVRHTSAARSLHSVRRPTIQNGRLVRLLNTLMALQAGWLPLDFDGIRGKARQRYIAAIHAAQGNDYTPLEQVFVAVLRRTLRTATSSDERT